MAPSKRSGTFVGPAVSKKARISSSDSTKTKYAMVAKALRGAKDILRPECAAMLEAVLPHCLPGVAPADAPAMHATQTATAALVARALAEIEIPLVQKTKDAEQDKQGLTEKHAEADGAADATRIALEAQVETNKSYEAELEEATKAVAGAEAGLAEAKAALEMHLQQSKAIEDERAQAEAAIKEHLIVLQTGAWSDGETRTSEVDAHLSILSPLCIKLELEESMLQALPIVAARRIEERGQFDIATLSEVEKRLVAHVEKLNIKLSEAESPKAEFQIAMDKAQVALVAAQGQQQASMDRLNNAVAEHTKLLGAQVDAQQNLRGVTTLLKKAEAMLNSANKQLTNFREGPLATFESLRSVDAKPEAEMSAKNRDALHAELAADTA